MMARWQTFTFRVSNSELELIDLIAKKLDRSRSDAMRLIVRQTAAAMGLTSVNGAIMNIEVIW